MNRDQLQPLKRWFDGYIIPFLETDPEGRKNIALKVEHTGRVCQAMALLADGEGLSEEEACIADAVALLHDVGRFPQFKRWRTFRDRDSDNHARLGIEVIREHRVLAGLTDAEQLLIEEAIRFHNVLTPPEKIQSPTRLFIDLIRDADKLDIWRVFVELLELPPEKRPSAATLGIPDLPGEISDECIAALADGQIVRLESVRVVNDLKLLQISWVYDLGFASSRRLLSAQGYIPALASTLPDRPGVREAVGRATAFLEA